MTLDTVGGRHNLPDVVLGDEREELETESGFDSVRWLGLYCGEFFALIFDREVARDGMGWDGNLGCKYPTLPSSHTY